MNTTTIISANRRERLRQFLTDLWDYRELFWTFVERDIKVRYKQTALGVIWVVLQPLLMTAVFTLVFGRLAGMLSENLPYAVFALAGLVPWNFFNSALTRGGVSLVSNAQLMSKVYFPRLILPVASVMGGLLDMMVVFTCLIGLMFFYNLAPTVALVWLPFFLFVAIVTALGISFWLSALNVRYRDVNYLIPFIAQFWMFATPVVYPASLIPERYRMLYGFNPMVGVVEGFRWALFGTGQPPKPMLAVSVGVAVVLFVSGVLVFRKMERTFADVV